MDKKVAFIILSVACPIFFSSAFANAADLSFLPSAGAYSAGSSFSVNVYVSSPDQAINAVSGTVSFPSDKLKVTSISKANSILNTWVQDPSFSNTAGTVDFQGIVLNPGFTGARGEVVTIKFKAVTAGSAPISFSSGSVLANDGNGTEVLKKSGSAQFTLSDAPPADTVKENDSSQANAPGVALPPAPQISSPTNPDTAVWYSDNTPKFTWQLTPDIIAVKISYDKKPVGKPAVIYKPAISEKDITDVLMDGVYYFHLQFENSAGWGPVSDFRFKIDTHPPEPFKISLVDGEETDNPQPAVSFSTADALSGVDYYKIKINNGDFFNIPPAQIINNSYILPPQTPGQKEIFVMALDKAGNYEVAYAGLKIKSIAPPAIADYTQKLENNEVFNIKGSSYPASRIIIWHQGEIGQPESWITTSDSQGNFNFTANKKLENGANKIWAQVIDKRGAKSGDSAKVTVIENDSILFKIDSWLAGNLFAVFIFIVFFLMLELLLVAGLYARKIHKKRKANK